MIARSLLSPELRRGVGLLAAFAVFCLVVLAVGLHPFHISGGAGASPATATPTTSPTLTPPTLTPAASPLPTRPASGISSGVYQSQMQSVLVVVTIAEREVGAALSAVRKGRNVRLARSDLVTAIANLRYAGTQLAHITPPRALAAEHRDVRRAVGTLVGGSTDVLRGIDTLNSRESDQGVHRFNQGLASLRRATRLLQGH